MIGELIGSLGGTESITVDRRLCLGLSVRSRSTLRSLGNFTGIGWSLSSGFVRHSAGVSQPNLGSASSARADLWVMGMRCESSSPLSCAAFR